MVLRVQLGLHIVHIVTAFRVLYGLTAHTLALTVDEEFHLVGIVVVAPHIDLLTRYPVPVGEEMQHRRRGPLALIHVVGVLGEACQVDDTKIGTACRESVGRGFTDVVPTRPDILSTNVGRMLHHIPCLLMCRTP